MDRWHADIKPDNILFVERVTVNTTFDGNENSEPVKREKTFKLADPGFARFIEKTMKDSEGVPKQRLRGGTETYGIHSLDQDTPQKIMLT